MLFLIYLVYKRFGLGKIPKMLGIVMMLAFGCSRVAVSQDSILGIWYGVPKLNDSATNTSIEEEWIFNDVQLGRYQRYSNNGLIYETDFSWVPDNGGYSIYYNDSVVSDVFVKLVRIDEREALRLSDGRVMASR